jgi:glycosyltransferase involved in cell wall biosynthesis
MVGIALLTLVPGELGGSETPSTVAPGARAGRRARVQGAAAARGSVVGGGTTVRGRDQYRLARTIPQRLVAMGAAAARPAPLRGRLRDADVVHYPLTLRIPAVRKPTVVSLLDLQHLDMPHLFSLSERAFRRVSWHRSVRSADRVITISEFSKGEIVKHLHTDPLKVRVIPPGIDAPRRAGNNEDIASFARPGERARRLQ